MKTLQESWREYRDNCFPNGMTADQNAQLHMTWFASALNLLAILSVDVVALTDTQAEAELQKLLIEAEAVCRHRATAVKSHN